MPYLNEDEAIKFAITYKNIKIRRKEWPTHHFFIPNGTIVGINNILKLQGMYDGLIKAISSYPVGNGLNGDWVLFNKTPTTNIQPTMIGQNLNYSTQFIKNIKGVRLTKKGWDGYFVPDGTLISLGLEYYMKGERVYSDGSKMNREYKISYGLGITWQIFNSAPTTNKTIPQSVKRSLDLVKKAVRYSNGKCPHINIGEYVGFTEAYKFCKDCDEKLVDINMAKV